MASASLRAASTNLFNRTVHVKIYPSARTFAERREVLKVLEKFGQVTMLTSLKHHPVAPVQNAFITIFSSETAAQEIINASPVRFRLIVEPDPLASSPVPQNSSSGGIKPPAQKPIEKVFSLSLNITRYTHDQYISHPLTNPMYGPFKPIDPKRSGIAAHLSKGLESSMWSKGLADWESDMGKKSAWNEGGKDEGKGGEEGGGGSRSIMRADTSSTSVPLRLVGKDLDIRREGRPRIMDGLLGLIGEGKG
ncbi:hypothetical protein SBOR_2727 [Sclerotinia borealis F-4128]|uniref:Pal1-like protein n=1 Tax=Sclerotinia borealis (strain F-4128) TaxID=1432307 RepID=W9CJE1_SCLBF|nr:hypothetical protein SBOR_2727 [Sclerotinia borealis F-4128]